jgi:hypothetical protein
MGQEFPSAEIGNRLLQTKLYLPDPANGSYRATRFDWSGIIVSLQYQGHEYFGQWYAEHDPLIHDAITGPVEVFDPDTGGPGYGNARSGGTFVRIGVGVLEKPEEASFSQFRSYKIVDHGAWRVRKGTDWIEFSQTLADQSGYAYVYTKRIRLAPGRPEMTIAHTLSNTGSKALEATQYNHNFFMIDHQPSGPGLAIRFPFDLKAVGSFRGFLEARGRELVYLKGLEEQQSAQSLLEGFGPTAKDYDITVENRDSGAGVRITGDRPMVRIYFWARKDTSCPEPYVRLQVPPGSTEKWAIRYHFYTLK